MMKSIQKITLLLAVISSMQLMAQSQSELIGRWDLTISSGDQELPGWMEVEFSGNSTLVGRFMNVVGSARPIAEVIEDENLFSFSIPAQWIGTQDLVVKGTRDGDRLSGHLLTPTGDAMSFTGVRAPVLFREAPKKWTKPVALFNGKDLSGWKAQNNPSKNQWEAVDGVLSSPRSGVNLMTEKTYDDFKLHIEFKYPEHSNSGIFLRGRYEVQVEDDYGKHTNSHYIGGVYGLLEPNQNAGKPAGEWQTYDITLVGRTVSVVLNGKEVISNALIAGITGGALDSDEAAPGPILLQGDHGPIQYRNITISVPKE
ncbi:MAG: DUF1080 domain-containing protein [Flavobacteriaceae bacterium]|jgi:hypothetical protein|nr:DUF1080 domain-containing protein [Flavobacteriaceae bacterium]NVJ72726.1 DUF1080 domain-containing protein [Flavobacteriaceae bacterium]